MKNARLNVKYFPKVSRSAQNATIQLAHRSIHTSAFNHSFQFSSDGLAHLSIFFSICNLKCYLEKKNSGKTWNIICLQITFEKSIIFIDWPLFSTCNVSFILDARGRPRAENPHMHHRSNRTDDAQEIPNMDKDIQLSL